MSQEKKSKLPTLAITTGDINGIGPELIVRMFSDNRLLRICTPVIYGSGKLFSKYRKILRADRFNFTQIDSVKEVKQNRVNVLNVWKEDVELQPGQEIPLGGHKAFESLEAACQDLYSNAVDALVTAPINKNNIQQEKFQFPGHTEYLAKLADQSSNFLMLMTTEDLKVGLVTAHIPLQKISQELTQELIEEKALILNKTLKEDFAIPKPKIALLGLNPHAGDQGLLGNEEQDIIVPAIEKLRNKDCMAFGPYSSDGFFGSFEFKKFDAVLAMYHDQGLIPFKTIAFENGVNYTAGLPVIRTSPDHGTAYGLVGKKKANTSSFREAIYLACDVFKHRESTLDIEKKITENT